jgi:hypothetical protein
MRRFIKATRYLVALTITLASCASMQTHYQEAIKANDIDTYEKFLAKHPNSSYDEDIKSRLHEFYYAKAKEEQNNLYYYETLINEHPHGPHITEVKQAVDKLQVYTIGDLKLGSCIDSVVSIPLREPKIWGTMSIVKAKQAIDYDNVILAFYLIPKKRVSTLAIFGRCEYELSEGKPDFLAFRINQGDMFFLAEEVGAKRIPVVLGFSLYEGNPLTRKGKRISNRLEIEVTLSFHK